MNKMNKIITFLTIALFIIPTYLFAAQSQNLESVLLEAASGGNTNMVKSFLDNGANIEIKNEVGATPLIFASAKGQKEVVALLLDRGANVNAKTTAGITPLMAAAAGGYPEIVKLLLAKGADVSAKDQQGRTAFSMAEASGDSQVSDLLKSAQKSSAPEQPRVASQSRSYTPQRSAGPSDSSPADSGPGSPAPDVSQGSDQSPASQPGGLLNNPLIGQVLSRVLGGQTSAPGPIAGVQSPDTQANVQNQPPGQAQNPLPAQGANAQPPAAQATTTVTKRPDGSSETKTFGDQGKLATATVFGSDGKKSETDTFGNDGKVATATVFGSDGKKSKTDTFGNDGKRASTTVFGPDGKTQGIQIFDSNGKVTGDTKFDQNGNKTVSTTFDSDGNQFIKRFTPDGAIAQAFTIESDGLVNVQCSTPSDCAKQLKAGANTLKANTTPQGLTATKQNAKADVLKQIQGKSSGDAKVAKTTNPDGSTSSVIKHSNGSTTTVTKNPDGSTSSVIKHPNGSTSTVTRDKLGSVVLTKDKNGGGAETGFDTNGKNKANNDALANKLQKLQGQQQNLTGNKQQGLASNKQQIHADVLNQIQNKAGSSGVKEDIKADFSKQIGSKFQAVPKSQSPSEFSQGNKHQPQNNLTKNYNAKSKSLNSNSSAGSQGTVKHDLYKKPR